MTPERIGTPGRRTALLVMNPVAGTCTPDEVRAAVDATLGAGGFDITEFRTPDTRTIEELRSALDGAVRAALDRRSSIVVVAGGDGTVGMTADSLARAERTAGLPRAALGLVPVGTGNVVARDLGVPIDLRSAAEVLLSGETRTIDAMEVDGHYYLSQVGVGLDARMIAATEREDQIAHGRIAYVASFLSEAGDHGPSRFAFGIDAHRVRMQAWQVVVANTGTLGTKPFTWGPNIDPGDGVLDLCVYNVRSPADYLALAWKILTGRHRRDRRARYIRVHERVVIAANPPLDVQADGEPLGRTPVEVRVARGALDVIVAAASERS